MCVCVCAQSDDLQQYEVEDFIAQLMHQEFDTLVDDGSLPQVCAVARGGGQRHVTSHVGPLCAGVRQPAADLRSVAAGGAAAAPTQCRGSVPEDGSEGKGHSSARRLGRRQRPGDAGVTPAASHVAIKGARLAEVGLKSHTCAKMTRGGH